MSTFADLPDALVRDLLDKALPVATSVSANISALRAQRGELRNLARSASLIHRKADLDVPREPSVVGIDGSYQIHRLTALDLGAAAAVAVEGTSKEAVRHWPQPYHQMWVEGMPHCVATVGPLRGLMVSMELMLAGQAPHDLVLLDGSFASLVIYLNQALTSLADCADVIVDEFWTRWQSGLLDRVLDLMRSDRTVAVPKFTARTELAAKLRVQPELRVDAKTIATLILEPGEYTEAQKILRDGESFHLASEAAVRGKKENACSAEQGEALNQAMKDLMVVYFRPYGWVPALRLELPGVISRSNAKLSVVLEGIQRQFFSPAVTEPYPLFLADRMVKSLGSGVAVVEQAVAQQVAENSVDMEMTMLFLQNYRTEGGRGGV